MHVYVIGDSISMQYGPYLEAALRGTGITYSRKGGPEDGPTNLDLPVGANGGDSAMVLEYLRARQRCGVPLQADRVLLNCGLHDIKTDPTTGNRQVPLELYRANLLALVELITRQMGLALVWIRTTPCDDRVHNTRPGIAFHRFASDVAAYNAAADAVMAAQSVPRIDLHTFTVNLGTGNLDTPNLGPELYCDHVHFVDAVRRQQAAFIAGWLDRPSSRCTP